MEAAPSQRGALVAIVAACLMAGLAAGAASAAGVPPALRQRALDEGPVRVIVELAVAARPEARLPDAAAVGRQRLAIAVAEGQVTAALGGPGRPDLRRLDDLPFLALEASAADLAALEASPAVRAVQEDRLLAPLLDQSVPKIGADVLHAAGVDGSGVAVAVLDTGFDTAHPFLQGATVYEACFSLGRDCPNHQTTQTGTGAAAFCTYASGCFHGTHVAGIVLGRPEAGLVGVAPGASLVAMQVFSELTGTPCAGAGEDPCALAYTSDIIAGLNRVFAIRGSFPIAAVNLSLGGGHWTSEASCDAADAATKMAIDNLRAAGIATFASSGNDGYTDGMGAPACLSPAVSVGATRINDAVWSGSNSASFLDLLAPGQSIASSVPPALLGYDYGSATGTSMAAPHAAGSLALARQAAPQAGLELLLQALEVKGVPVLDGRNGVTTPRVQVDQAVAALQAPACSNGLDDDFDGLVDFPDDPGCLGYTAATESPLCDDGQDNDGDGGVDWNGGPSGEPADLQCKGNRWHDSETVPPAKCGLGFELAPVLAALAAWAQRRRRRVA